MSIEPWTTETDGAVGWEDMPRKSIDIKLMEDPVHQKKELLRPLPAFRRGRVRAGPEIGSRGAEHPVDVRFVPTETECRGSHVGSLDGALSH